MIRIEKLFKEYPNGTRALNGVSFELRDNEVLLLLGPNGAGKSTCIRIMLGLRFATSGSICPTLDPAGTGYIPEGEVGKVDWTVDSYLAFLGRLRGLSERRTTEQSRRLLEKLGIGHASRMKLRELSKGMKQRFKWAQALLHDPAILVLDEPTSDLDPVGKKEIRDLVRAEKERGKTILLSSHLLAEVEKVGDRFVILNHGSVVSEGMVEQVRENGDLEGHFLAAVSGSENQ